MKELWVKRPIPYADVSEHRRGIQKNLPQQAGDG